MYVFISSLFHFHQVRKSSVAKAKAEEEMSDSLRQMEEVRYIMTFSFIY